MTDENIAKFTSPREHTPAHKISPREILMMALNSVDEFDAVVIVMGRTDPENGTVTTRVNHASPNQYITAGLLNHALLTHWE